MARCYYVTRRRFGFPWSRARAPENERSHFSFEQIKFLCPCREHRPRSIRVSLIIGKTPFFDSIPSLFLSLVLSLRLCSVWFELQILLNRANESRSLDNPGENGIVDAFVARFKCSWLLEYARLEVSSKWRDRVPRDEKFYFVLSSLFSARKVSASFRRCSKIGNFSDDHRECSCK